MLRKLFLKDWKDYFALVAVLLAIVSASLYGVMRVGENSVATIILLVIGMVFSLVYFFTDIMFTDMIAYVFFLLALGFFILSKAVYVSAVFVGIDYKSFDPVFIADLIFLLLTGIVACVAYVLRRKIKK